MVCRAYDERLRVEMIPGFHMEIIEGRFSDARHDAAAARPRADAVAAVGRAGGPQFPPAHVGRRDAHAPVRPARRRDAARRSTTRARRCPASGCSTSTPSAAAGGSTTASGCTTGCWSRTTTSPTSPPKELAAFLSASSSRSRAEDPSRLVEVEVDTLEQLREVLKVDGVDVILLDNMDCPRMERPSRCATRPAARARSSWKRRAA